MEYFKEVDGLKLFVREEGQGPPLVLCHGWSLDRSVWADVCEHFADRHRVVIVEMRGHGRSECGGHVPFQRLAHDLVDMLDSLALDESPILCGHSLGGDLVLQIALDWPTLPRAIVMADAPGPHNAFTNVLSWASLSITLRTLRTIGVRECPRPVSPFMARLFYGAAFRRERKDAMALWRTQWAANNVDGILNALRAQAWREDVRHRLSQVAVPTLVINGARDRLARVREARRYADSIPGARLAILADVGHMSLAEAPEAFCAEIDAFIASLPGRPSPAATVTM